MKGDKDLGIAENLKTAFVQDYEPVHYYFCCEGTDDPALAIMRSVAPSGAHIEECAGDADLTVKNPKVANSMQAYGKIGEKWIWCIDSNTRLPHPAVLRRMVDELARNPRVHLVHQLPVICDAENQAAKVEAAFMNTAHAKLYVFLNILAPTSCVVGKSFVVNKADLDAKGGLRHFGTFLGEVRRSLALKGFDGTTCRTT